MRAKINNFQQLNRSEVGAGPHGRPLNLAAVARGHFHALSSPSFCVLLQVFFFFLIFMCYYFSSSLCGGTSLPAVLCASPALCSVKGGGGEFHLLPSPGHSVLLRCLGTPSPRIMHISQGAVQRSASLSRDSEVGVLFLIEMKKRGREGEREKARRLPCLMDSRSVPSGILWDFTFLFVPLCCWCELLSS